MSEIWKDVVGYEGVYEVSNIGRVKTLSRMCRRVSRKGMEFSVRMPEKILSARKTQYGYWMVGLGFEGDMKYFLVHRLVAAAFLDNPENREQVNHKNGVRSDSRVENLEWVTQSENMYHACSELGFNGERVASSKLKNSDIVDIRFLFGWGVNQNVVADLYGLSKATVNRLYHGRTWKHVA